MKWVKKLMYLSLIFMAISCGSDDDFSSDDPVGDDPDIQDPVEEKIGKRGVAFTNSAPRWSHRTSEMKAHWMYSWGNFLREEIPENVEFVPMIWGRGAANDEVISRLKVLKREGKIKYLLGFNEPDGASQANMTVDEAIELWPKLEELGVPLGSPATINPNNDWMKEFMQRADAEGLRVDFICIHNYGGGNVTNFVNMLSQTYRDYGQRPIWITEFAVADWNATSTANNKHTRQDVINFMEQILPALEQIDYVERYAWFDGRQAPLYTSSLYDEDFNVTSVGNYYAEFNPNEEVGPGQDTEFEPPVVDGELIVNGGFETGQISPWQGFKNGVVGVQGTEPHTGNFSGRIENNDGSLYQVVEVEAGKTYELQYFTKWGDAVDKTFSGGIRDEDANELLFSMDNISMSTEWTEGNFEFTVPDGVSNIRVLFFKGQVDPPFPPIFFDDISLKEKE